MRKPLGSGLALMLALCFSTSRGSGQSLASTTSSAKALTQVALNSGARPTIAAPKIPLEFEANHGQAPAQFDFVAHGQSYTLGISSSGIALTIDRPASSKHAGLLPVAMDLSNRSHIDTVEHAQLNLRLLGSNLSSKAQGLQPKESVSNYFIGSDPAKWHTRIPHFGKVERSNVYPGIDLVFYGNPKELEYDFRVTAGADPDTIRIAADGASAVSIDGDGNLVLTTAAGDVQLKHPSAYQDISGVRRAVTSAFSLDPDSTIRLTTGAYDHSQPLIIDPVLNYAAAFGGSDGNQALGMDVDAAGNVYLTGNSCSPDFPTTAGNFQGMTSNPAIYACQDAFALKLNPAASGLVYADYFGGSGASTGTHVAVDSSGDLFVTGATTSSNFPLSGNIGPPAPQACPLFQSPQDCPDGFLLKLSPDGSTIAFSTLLGGSQATVGFQVKLNPVTGDVAVLGMTNSANFQPTLTGPQTTYQGGTCDNNACLSGFLLGLDPSSGALRYGTFLGGAKTNYDAGLGFDSLGNIYVAGATQPPLSSSLGNVAHTYAPAGGAAAGGMDIVVSQLKLSKNNLSVGYLTLIQGEGDDIPSGLAVDAAGNAYITGSTASQSLPVTAGVYQSSNKGGNYFGCLWTFSFPAATCGTIFVGKLDPTGALSFLTYMGGTSTDWGEAIGVDSLGNIWLTAATTSNDFPFTKDGYGLAAGSDFTPLLAEMSNNGQTLSFASPVAGLQGRATDLKIDSSNNVFLTGYAYTAPTTPGTYSDNESPLQPLQYPLFVQKWSAGAEPILSVSTNALAFGPTLIGSASPARTVTLSNTGAGPLELGIQTVSTSATGSGSAFAESDNCGSVLAPNGTCTLSVRLQPSPLPADCTVANGCAPQQQIGVIVIQNNAPSETQKITLTGTSGVGPIAAIAPRAITFPAQVAGTTSNPQYVQISNQGDLDLVVNSATLSGPNAADFQVTNSCTSALPPGDFNNVCTATIVFSPAASATGNRTATLTIVDNSADSPQTIPITGSVASAAAALDYFPNPVTFFPTLIGAPTYASQATLDVTNLSSATEVMVTGVTITGPNAADFHLLPNGHNGQLALNPGDGGEIGFYFNPTSGTSGPRTATATLTTSPVIPGLAPIPLQSVATGSNDPGISLYSNPSPMDLGSVQVGQSSQGGSNYLLIGNIGSYCATSPCGGPLVISSIAFGISDYAVISQPGSPAYCTAFPVTIPVNGGCGFNVIFTPTQGGTRNTTLTINSNDPGGPLSVPVSGTGLSLPIGNLSAVALSFGYAAIGVSSPPVNVTLTNGGSSPLTVASVSSSVNFGVQSNGCATPVAPGASCTIGVTFNPPTAGSFSGTLTVADNDALGGQQTVALSGIGATGASLMISPKSINFASQGVNTTSSPHAITLTNFGDTVITFPAGAFAVTAGFTVASNTCGSTLTLQASCVVNVEFAPTTMLASSGTLSISDNARDSVQRVYLIGAGLAATNTLLTSSASPISAGQPLTFTAEVVPVVLGVAVGPTGTVTFFNGTAAIGTATLSQSYTATLTTSTLPAGTDAITAVYNADSNFGQSTSTVLSQVVNSANQVNTTATLMSSINPSTAGQSVTFSVSVAGTTSNSPLPTGTVTFYDGASPLGSNTLSSAQTSFSSAGLGVGSHSITATYGSDANYAGSTSTSVMQVVNAPPQVATTTALISSQNPGTSGQSITFTATVSGTTSNSPLPTGSIVFYDGTTSLGSGTLNVSAQATYTTSALALGSHSIIAAYGSSSAYAASTSTILTQLINAPTKGSTATTLASSANPAGLGVSISFTATVAGVNSNTPVPTGTVNFLDGAATIGSGTVNASGTASFATSSLAQGSHSITAQYAGDANDQMSTSIALSQVIAAAPSFSLSLSPAALTVGSGQNGTSTLTLISSSGFNQPVSFACSGLPQFATCTFNPATVTPAANGTVTATVIITTNVATGAVRGEMRDRGRGETYAAFIGFGVIALLRKRNRSATKKSAYVVFILLAGLLGAVAASGCGGGVNHLTPFGATSVTITASGGSFQQSQTLTLTVQ
jgi:hypothetical protein